MNERLRRWLDGELELDELSPELRARARSWERLFEDLRAREPVRAPPGLEAEVMRRVRAADPPGSGGEGARSFPEAAVRALRWLVRPRPVPIPPAAAVAAVALIAFLVMRPGGDGGPPPAAPDAVPAAASTAGTRVYAEFVLRAPDADSVAVAGTFTGWRPSIALTDPDGDGVWSARVPLEAGRHEYMFVVDGRRWITDPSAQRYASDGFGRRNAVLAVAPPDQRRDG